MLDRFADADPVAQEAEVRESKNGPPRAAIVWNFVLAGQETSEGADLLVVTISEDGHSLVLPSAERAGFLRRGLALVEGEELTNTKLLNLPIPPNQATSDALSELIATFDPLAVEARVEARVDEIDRIVGRVFGLTTDDLAFIQADMRDDPQLARADLAQRALARPDRGCNGGALFALG